MCTNGVILATASYDHTIKLWSPDQVQFHSIEYSTKKRQSQFQVSKSAFFINRIEVSHDKQYLGAAASFSAYIYDLGQAPLPDRPKFAYDGYQNNVTSIGFKQNNGWIYTSSEDGSIKIHDLAMQGISKTFSSKEPVNQVVLHPNEVELISADQAGNVKIWDLRKDTQCRKKLVLAPEIGLRSVSVAINAQFFCAADSSGSLFIYKLGKNDEISSMQKIEKAHDDYILKCQISPLVTSIATCSADKTIKIWSQNLASQKFEYKNTLYGHQKWVWDVAYGCDGEFLFSCSSDNNAKLWKFDENQQQVECTTFKGHQQTVNCVAFNDITIKS
ncbi:hypothetical protein ABPG72_001151 [Tetrahymena utriculariae]